MKKLITILPLFLILGSATTVFAAKNSDTVSNANTGQQIKMDPSPAGNYVQDQNQIKTQNQGVETSIQTSNQEQENLQDGSNQTTQSFTENMSQVDTQVKLLLQVKTMNEVGEQVKVVAQEQAQAQNKIQDQINKLESKSKLAKMLTGTDYGAVKNLKQQLEQNKARVMQLEQLLNQLANEGDIKTVQETILSLNQTNENLESMIKSEEQTKSLFGWLVKLFTI